MSYQFTMVLSREITEEESSALREAGCPEATLTTAALPTDASLAVTQLDFDTEGPTLADVLEAALESVKAVPDLSPASLTVPPHPEAADAAEASETDASKAEGAAEAVVAEAEAVVAEASKAKASKAKASKAKASKAEGAAEAVVAEAEAVVAETGDAVAPESADSAERRTQRSPQRRSAKSSATRRP